MRRFGWNRRTMPPPGRIEAATAAPIPLRQLPIDLLRQEQKLQEHLNQVEADERYYARLALRKQERLNRIGKLTPVRQRIRALDAIANSLEYEADSATDPQVIAELKSQVLQVRRMEWDLGELRDAVRGDKRMPGARNDPTLWRGPRP